MKKILENPLTIIVITCFLATFNIWPTVFLSHHGYLIYKSIFFQIASTISACIMMAVIPILYIRTLLKRKVYEFGLRLPDNRRVAIIGSFIATFICLPVIFLFAQETSFQNYYSASIGMFALNTILSGTYYVAEEFLFRGFFQFGVWNKFKLHSIWIVNTIFAILHAGKPWPEVFFAFYLGIVLSLLSQKTKSVVPAAVVHFILAFILNTLVIFT